MGKLWGKMKKGLDQLAFNSFLGLVLGTRKPDFLGTQPINTSTLCGMQNKWVRHPDVR